eukprot:s1825_g12.t1
MRGISLANAQRPPAESSLSQQRRNLRLLSNTRATEERLDKLLGDEVQLIIRSPGLAYALNDFLEVISHLRREYNVTRSGQKYTTSWKQLGGTAAALRECPGRANDAVIGAQWDMASSVGEKDLVLTRAHGEELLGAVCQQFRTTMESDGNAEKDPWL